MPEVRLDNRWPGLMKLLEECSELSTVAAKLAAFPDGGEHPDGNGDLLVRLEDEVADLYAILQWFEHENDLDVDPARIEMKLERYDEWHKTGKMAGVLVRRPVYPSKVDA